MLLCSVLLWDSNPSEPVPTQQRERGGKYPYSIKVVGKGRRHSQRELLPSALEPFSFKGKRSLKLNYHKAWSHC
jgi:hypothetical protein